MPEPAKRIKATIYHNTKCRKSNAALGLLLEQGVEVSIVNYLETALSSDLLKNLLCQLGIEAKALLRFGEPIAKELGIGIDDILDDDQWLAFMIHHPVLIERPIVVINNKAIIARPAERVLALIQNS